MRRCLILLALAAALVPSGGQAELPPPTGAYGVGVWGTSLVTERPDALSGDGSRRELLLQVWYPAHRGGIPKPYVTERVGMALTSLGLPAALHTVRTHSARDAVPQDGPFPVVVMSHGLSWPGILYQSLTEDLASHGYVVVMVTHPHGAAALEYPDGRVLDMSRWPKPTDEDARQRFLSEHAAVWAADLADVLGFCQRSAQGVVRNVLTGRLDVSRVAVAGHSYGGTAAARMLQDDRVRGAVALEGKARPTDDRLQPLPKPFMHVIGGYNRLELEGTGYEPHPGVPFYEVIVAGAWHASFSDFVLLYKPSADAAWRERHRYELEPQRVIAIVRDYLRAFLGRVLDGTPHPLLQPVSYADRVDSPRTSRYPEVELNVHIR